MKILFFVALLVAVGPAITSAQPVPPGFSKSFDPDTIGPGSVANLKFVIVNNNSVDPVSDLAFTDSLPAGMTIATPSSAFTNCTNAVLSAPAGGATITLSDGDLGAGGTCFVAVNVTSSTVGAHANVSGALTSSVGEGETASATLTVSSSLPGLTKSFAPSTISQGQKSVLTLTIDNSAEGSVLRGISSLVDPLPVGMIIATPANASTTCTGSSLTAESGTNIVSLFSGSVPANSTCDVTVDVTTISSGVFVNTTSELTLGFPSAVSCGFATAALDVPVEFLAKSFTDDPVPPGGTVTLEFTIQNPDRANTATAIAFTDPLPAGLTATPSGTGTCNGTLTGTTTLTYSGGSLAGGASCSFDVTLSVPGTTAVGPYINTTTAITATIDGEGVTGNTATDTLVVSAAPILTKEFIDDPVGAGGTVTLRFSITNPSSTSTATDIAFSDVFFVGLPTASAVPTNPVCNSGTATFTPLFNPPSGSTTPAQLMVTGASLAAQETCTIDITLDVAVGVPAGTYPNVTTPISATVDDAPVFGIPARDDLVVVAGPRIFKEFTDDPVDPGDTVTLEFTLSHDSFAPGDATAIAFSDDLDSTLTGLVATGLPAADVCGAGSQISGTSTLSLTGGTLAPGGSCTFSVTLSVPGGAAPGSHTNTTSTVTATVLGVTTTENPASDDLEIATLSLHKEFTDDPVIAGGDATLRFTLTNASAIDATGIAFNDDLAEILPTGPDVTVLTSLPMSACGGTLSAPVNTFLSYAGGSVTANTTCSFDVAVNVPAGTADNTYLNITTGVASSLGTSDPAVAELIVDSLVIEFTKEFTDDPAAPGDTVTLEFTLSNLDAVNGVSALAFTDDLDAALTDLTFDSVLTNDCGATVAGVGTTDITVSGGSLTANSQCTISVAVQVPAAAATGLYTNTTSQVTGTLGGLPIVGDPASDNLSVSFFTFSKQFGGPVPAGGITTLEFTIVNQDASSGAVGIAFSDDLDAVVPGMVAVGLPVADVCGPGSVLSGTSFLTMTGGNLPPSGSCTILVDVQIPLAAPEGIFTNTTTALSQGGIPSGAPASADIVIEPALAGENIPVTTPFGTAALIVLISAAALWRLRWRL